MLKYFKGSFIIMIIGLIMVFGIVYLEEHNISVAVQAIFTAALLSVLEISLSFDNAVVNATVMKKMDDVWRKRFLTWGMLIAVFGMRLLFPLIIVSVIAKIDPVSALILSIKDPNQYGEIMLSSHIYVAAFGGMFLFLVGIHFFFDQEKEEHWFGFLEIPFVKAAGYQGVEIILALAVLLGLSKIMPDAATEHAFLMSGAFGMFTFLLVHGLSATLEKNGIASNTDKVVAASGIGTFMYLEVLDASFSFDGVVGAFALTNNLFIIMIGLGIGAFFVRSLTIYFVEKETVEQFKYLEHGAFYAIILLGGIMLLDPLLHIPEWLTGIGGAVVLAASVVASIHSRTADSK